jgi:LysM repeat protein
MIKKADVLDNDLYIRYKVKKNDSILRISFLSGISEKQIRKLNNLSNSSLVEGQVLTLPKFVKETAKKQGILNFFKKS